MPDSTTRPQRKHLPHDVPSWVPDESVFFITITCKPRGVAQLTDAGVSGSILESVEHYQKTGKWWCHLFLLMPDHMHALLVFPRDVSMRRCIASWKSWHARRAGIEWQDGFFDHRIRNDNALQEKVSYIRNNPVRAGLVERVEDWPHLFEGNS